MYLTDPAVIAKMTEFHIEMASLLQVICSICLELGLYVNGKTYTINNKKLFYLDK